MTFLDLGEAFHRVNRNQLWQILNINGISYHFVFLGLQPIVGVFLQPGSGLHSPRVRGFLLTHNDAPQSEGLLWTRDQSVAETST
jgi:hypothetical protein